MPKLDDGSCCRSKQKTERKGLRIIPITPAFARKSEGRHWPGGLRPSRTPLKGFAKYGPSFKGCLVGTGVDVQSNHARAPADRSMLSLMRA